MQIIPTDPVASQTFGSLLAGQNTQINLYQKSTGLYMDVLIDSNPIVYGVLCENLNRIIRSAYLGYRGDFAFIDNQGTDDPVFTGLGTRFSLAYIPADELPAEEG